MIFTLSAWLTICQLYGLVLGYCLYGDDHDCALQCHCAIDSECSEGICSSGCDASRPSGNKWGGPTCQIGNIGLGKSTNMTASDFYQEKYPAAGALDGIIPPVLNASCAHLCNDPGLSLEWWTDLGDVYQVYNITIYARRDGPDDRLQRFTLTVYNTSADEVVCGSHRDPVYTNVTLTCSRPLIGRFVHFKKDGTSGDNGAALCEVVIMGHRYIDCTQCPVGIKCNDVTGCEACYGSYQPDCKQDCEAGFYGRNCQERCGNCKSNTECDRYNGTCHDGCQIWWTDTKCNTYIELPIHKDEELTLVNKTSNSIEIAWEHIDGMSPHLSSFYGYLIQYKEVLFKANYTEGGTVNYNSTLNWKLENLRINTVYYIKVAPFRRYGNIRQLGTPYETLQVKTKCTAPETAQISKVVVLHNDGGLYCSSVIVVTYKVVASIESNCDKITNATLVYKTTTSTMFHVIHLDLTDNMTAFVVEKNAEYEIQLFIENNEGYTSSSDMKTVTVKDGSSSLQKTLLTVSGVLNAIFIIVIVTLSILLWKSRQKLMTHKCNNFSMVTKESSHGLGCINASEARDVRENIDDIIQYEDVMANVEPRTRDASNYEGLSLEGTRIYQNNMVSGPYAELKQN